jgi:hypothetical protein
LGSDLPGNRADSVILDLLAYSLADSLFEAALGYFNVSIG